MRAAHSGVLRSAMLTRVPWRTLQASELCDRCGMAAADCRLSPHHVGVSSGRYPSTSPHIYHSPMNFSKPFLTAALSSFRTECLLGTRMTYGKTVLIILPRRGGRDIRRLRGQTRDPCDRIAPASWCFFDQA